MSGAWGGFKNGAIPLAKMLKVEGEYFEPSAGHAIIAALAECRKAGIHIGINEGYRPLGVPADRKVRDEHKTSTGGSNQYFQKGREDRGETPSAATPGFSIHGFGKAADVSNGGNSTVRSIFARHGYSFNIASEVWHCEHVGAPKPAPAKPAKVSDWKSVQTFLKAHYGYSGAIDGIPGPKTWTAAQRWLKASFGYSGAVDGIPGPLTYAALKRAGSNLR